MAAGRRSSRRAERDLISGNRTEVKSDGYGEVVRLTQGSPPDLTSEAARRLENQTDKENPKRGGVRGGRSTDNTEEAGPAKPGDRAEEKTLRTRKVESSERC